MSLAKLNPERYNQLVGRALWTAKPTYFKLGGHWWAMTARGSLQPVVFMPMHNWPRAGIGQ